MMSRKFTAGQAARRVIYLAGWKEDECRYWMVKKSNGEFIRPTGSLNKQSIKTHSNSYSLYFEHLHSLPLLEEASPKTVERIKEKNALIKQHVKNFEYEADGVGEAPLEEVPRW